MTARIVTVFLLLIFFSLPAHALSISPARITLDAETGGTATIRIFGFDASGTLEIRAEPPLILLQQSFEVTPADTITIEVSLPAQPDAIPGDTPARVIAAFAPDGQTGTFAARAEVASQVVARRAYPGPYLVANLFVSPDEGRDDLSAATITFENRGTMTARPAAVEISVAGTAYDLDPIEVPPGGAVQRGQALEGRGIHSASLLVDGEEIISQEVTLGRPVIREFTAQAIPETGDIIPIAITADVDWNRPVDGVVRVAGAESPIRIDGPYSGTVYADTLENATTVTLTIGRQTRTLDVILRGPGAEHPGRYGALVVVVLILLLVVMVLVYVLYRRIRE